LAAIHALDAICFPSDIAFSRKELLDYIADRKSITRVARLDGTVVGFSIGKIERKYLLHILTLDVAPGMRRRKIGTTLMRTLQLEGIRRGARLSILEVDVGNAAARRFYELLQYRYGGILPGYYNGRRDACRMIRILRPHTEGD
jgi:ribosomal protein S18 acetylase RimI-like enzyme